MTNKQFQYKTVIKVYPNDKELGSFLRKSLIFAPYLFNDMKLIKQFPNDQQLGSHIRKIYQ